MLSIEVTLLVSNPTLLNASKFEQYSNHPLIEFGTIVVFSATLTFLISVLKPLHGTLLFVFSTPETTMPVYVFPLISLIVVYAWLLYDSVLLKKTSSPVSVKIA